MYSKAVMAKLKGAGANVGDRISVGSDGKAHEGLLMPRIESGDADCIVLKLDSGYNIGIDCSDAEVALVEKSKPVKARAEGASRIDGALEGAISLLSTGGTIASKIDYKTGAVSPALSASGLVATCPRIRDFAPISVKPLMSVFSEDMNPALWADIAKAAESEFSDGASGVIIAHGTDTMGYTSAALSYALQNLPGPIILTGSQRSSDRGSSDAQQNLICSCIASRGEFAGVGICMHATSSDTENFLHIGTRARKNHSSARAAFKSIGVSPIAKINCESGRTEYLWKDFEKRGAKKKISLKPDFSDNVHLAYVYPGLTPKTVEKWSGYDGVVLAGTGLGHAPLDFQRPNSPNSILGALEDLISSGIHIAMASQALWGRVHLQAYATGRMLGKIGVMGHGADWLPETAFVKMCWVLGQTKEKKKVSELMMKPVCHDITERSAIDETE